MKEREKFSIRDRARRFRIGTNTVYKCSKRIEPIKECKQIMTKIDINILRRDVKKSLDAYQYKRAKRLGVIQVTVYFGLKRIRIT